ncbi:MAG TPA: error-prone DNA polymerase [Methylomirabilota bacterium]|nr:error-prone DNA polymerase [Methylomirabilota bacterium]
MGAALLSDYAELHLHTNYSLLDGASHPEELIERAGDLGYRAAAITDHDNLFGAMVFARLCKEASIQPITGAELTLAADDRCAGRRHHLTVLAATREGYGNLCRLVSLANGLDLDGSDERERRRRDPCLPLHRLPDHCEGLVCLTGCRRSEVASLTAEGRTAEAETALRRWVAWFGPRRVFVELQDNLVHGDRARNRALARLAWEVGVETVATGDVHYHDPARHRLQDALVAIKHRTTLDESHQLRRPNREFHLRSPALQARRFREFPEAVANTLRVAETCSFDLTEDLGYRLPEPPVPAGHTPDSWLAACCSRELAIRYSPEERPKAEQRLGEELRLIRRHGLAGFFLVYKDVLDLAREVAAKVRGEAPRARVNLPPGRGRGSSVGSLVCYLVGLSHIDPIRNRLFLGRFLNEEMHSLPDIDLDFPRDIREELIRRVHERWGPERAALVATIPRYRVRSAIRDLGKALGLPEVELDRLAKLSEGYGSSRALREEMQRVPQFRALVDAPGWRELVELAWEIHDFPRHLSQHVGGMVIASEPLVECVPVQPAAWPNRYVCHWDKDSIDDARMVKIDFLGLGMLSLVEECLDLIAEHQRDLVDLSRIDFGDERVFGRIQEGDTVGVFQIESRAQAQMLPRTRPQNLDDLTVQVAIVRPGPIVGGAVNPYVKAREAQREGRPVEPKAMHPSVAGVLGETLGVVLFQEQVVQVAICMGGMTPGQAERLRRAMSRRDWHRWVGSYREDFMRGALARGVPEQTAADMFRNLEGFAAFGFPKSHAAAFGLLAYQSAWLKEHYPAEFYCALYNNWPMGFYPPHVFTNDARRHDVDVRGPDVNASAASCTVEGGAVRIGLGYVHELGRAGAGAVVAARQEAGPFRSLFDFVHRTGLRVRAVENLIRVGAFGDLGLNRRELLWQLGLFGGGLEQGRPGSRSRPRQLRLALPTIQDQVFLPDLSAFDRVAADYEVLKLSPEDHPMSFQRARLDVAGVAGSAALREMRPRQRVETAGLVVCRQRPATARGIVFLLLEDENGLVNVLVPRELYERERERMLVRTSAFLRIGGLLEGHAGAVPMIRAQRVDRLQDETTVAMRTPDGKSWG